MFFFSRWKRGLIWISIENIFSREIYVNVLHENNIQIQRNHAFARGCTSFSFGRKGRFS